MRWRKKGSEYKTTRREASANSHRRIIVQLRMYMDGAQEWVSSKVGRVFLGRAKESKLALEGGLLPNAASQMRIHLRPSELSAQSDPSLGRNTREGGAPQACHGAVLGRFAGGSLVKDHVCSPDSGGL